MKEKKIRNKYIVDLRNKGLTFSAIGSFWGISRQAAHTIYHRRHHKSFLGVLWTWLMEYYRRIK